ncbi:hypothetical protein AB0L06_14655 [Spirillospora sp. NPDC052269]
MRGVAGTLVVADEMHAQIDASAGAGAGRHVAVVDVQDVGVDPDVREAGGKVIRPGRFIHAPAGSSHVPQTASGCTLFLFYPLG